MSPIAEAALVTDAVATAAYEGLTSDPKSLPAWLLYDETGSRLFEAITTLPEYYLTRTERALFAAHADELFAEFVSAVTVVELGAGTASKTGILLEAATRFQLGVLYQPIDISPTALDEARASLQAQLDGLTVRPQLANYITDRIHIEREPDRSVLALYIGSSIGNFSPAESRAILRNLRSQLRPGDRLLLGTDLAPGPRKTVAALIAAYDDAAGVTAAFNLNLLTRLNRDLRTDFNPDNFLHQARWNAAESRMEMHLASTCDQTVSLPAGPDRRSIRLRFEAGETIHTENSYKFTAAAIASLLADSGFKSARTFNDPDCLYAVTLATAC